MSLAGSIAPDGWVFDFERIQSAMAPILGALDHRLLNDVEDLGEPTAEHIAVYIFDRLKPTFLGYLYEVTVHETATSRASYRGERA